MIRAAGMMFVYESAENFKKSAFAFGLARRHGVAIEEMSGAEARVLNPALGGSVKCAAFFSGNVHTTNPSRLVKELASFCRPRRRPKACPGAPNRRQPADDYRPRHLEPRFVVVAAGVWSKALRPALVSESRPRAGRRRRAPDLFQAAFFKVG